jgi:putative ABC transport system permease protein
VAVLAGALMVGASVRASLRDLALERLGRTDHVIVSTGFFREELAAAFGDAVPIIAAEGFVVSPETRRRASRVQVYGIDDRFWDFHQVGGVAALDRNDTLVSEALAAELATDPGASVVLRMENGSAIPLESLHGRKEDVGRTLRLTVRDVLPRDKLGDFSLSPSQAAVRAMFVSLERLQLLLQQQARANAVLVAGHEPAAVSAVLQKAVTSDDFGLRLRMLQDQNALAVDSRSTMLTDGFASLASAAAARARLSVVPTLTYLANAIRTASGEIPYSTITAIDMAALAPHISSAVVNDPNAIVLNEWAVRELKPAVGDPITVEYYVWEHEGRLATRSAQFRFAGAVPIEGIAGDRNLVPEYPGITDSDRVADWDPPFPIDLRRVRPIDEEYWDHYRATPKAFIALGRGQELWRSRHGALTALRLRPAPDTPLTDARAAYESALRGSLDPLSMGFSVHGVRAQSLEASTGATDFGAYFTYFSTFLVVSALLLAGSFFRLGVEQRLQEIGLLQALGLDAQAIGRLFVAEGVILSLAGGLLGIAGAIGYAALIMLGLRTWWMDAVGTTALALHVDPMSLAAGAAGVVCIAVGSIWWSLRSLARASARSLLKGAGSLPSAVRRADRPVVAGVTGGVAILLIVAAWLDAISRVAGFFGAGALALVAMLSLASWRLRHGRRGLLGGHGLWAIVRLGWRNTAYRPSRSVLCMALIAFATFVIVAVEAFKRDDSATLLARNSGGGGYPLLMETLLPIVHDVNASAGRDALNLPSGALAGVRFDRFRLRPGDDASCLNLYQPKNPRILGATPAFITSGRFAFQSSLAESAEERANPWLLLTRDSGDGSIPVITDANSMTYVLHMKLGDVLELPGASSQPVRLRLVAALSDSILQGELVMGEQHFVRAFPDAEGYRFFLIDAPGERTSAVTETLETSLTEFGADIGTTAERLAGFHRVEYTYLSTFQMLGGLGLLLGTFGLGAMLLRNVLERRRELAVLRALGYRQRDFLLMVVAENIVLLLAGLTAGTVSALLAIAPTWVDRGGRLPAGTIVLLLAGVIATGLLASVAATAVALRAPLLSSLRTE